MTVNKFLLSFTFFLIVSFCETAQQADNQILWVNNTRLTWDDFKGNYDTVVYNRQFAANTHWSLRYKYKISPQTGLNIDVFAYFIPNASWVKDESKKKDALLRHEQLHFDLTELFARKLRKFLSDKTFTLANCKEELRGYFAIFLDELKATQHTYDDETNHGLKKDEQASWEASIPAQIKALADFSATNISPKLER